VTDKSERCIERLLTYFSLCDELSEISFEHADHHPVPQLQRSFVNIPLTHFDGAEATFAYPEELGGMTSHGDRNFFCDVSPSDLTGCDWDISWLHKAKGHVIPSKENKTPVYAVTRVRRVPLKEIRGFFPLKTGLVIEYAQAVIYNDGSYTPSREYLERRGGIWIVVGQPREVYPEPIDEQGAVNIQLSLGFAFTRYYDWMVKIRAHPALPSIALATDPIGAREAFKMRDVPKGKSRREALKHWVSGHWRRKRTADAEDQSWVDEFLRGASQFTWNGMDCTIVPAAYDLKRLAVRDERKKKSVLSTHGSTHGPAATD
jgi:hypothetical protein